MESLSSLLVDVSKLPSLPAIAVKIIKEIRKNRSSVNELADIISFDPALTAKVLRVANSSFYGLSCKVDSIDRAVNILGLETLKNIALSFVIVRGFRRNSVDRFDQELFWKRSITAAVCSELMASRLKKRHDDAFVTALLMDIGVLVMYLSRPDDYLKVIDEKMISMERTADVEKIVFGVDHQEVGSIILKEWGIPENIYVPIAYHHRVQEALPEFIDTAEVLMLSDMASSIYYGQKNTEKLRTLNKLLQKKLDKTEADISKLIDSVAEKTVEVLSTFDIKPGDIKPISEIVQDAHQEIRSLGLSYDQLVLHLKQEKTKSEHLARELKRANEKLRAFDFHDSLTGIYNHRFFHEILDKEMERAERYSRSLSLIMIDIDNFREINDAYGHQQGDIVLCAVAELLQQSIRMPDTVSRYGGEEFAIILPEDDISGAVSLAERIRQMVERMEIKSNKQVVKITVSAGATMYDPIKNIKNKTKILETVEKALFYSKKTGRNKLSVVPFQ
jgi:diguanylate cyclase (GGDEF)-like protein